VKGHNWVDFDLSDTPFSVAKTNQTQGRSRHPCACHGPNHPPGPLSRRGASWVSPRHVQTRPSLLFPQNRVRGTRPEPRPAPVRAPRSSTCSLSRPWEVPGSAGTRATPWLLVGGLPGLICASHEGQHSCETVFGLVLSSTRPANVAVAGIRKVWSGPTSVPKSPST
jgi:hypothetical protein